MSTQRATVFHNHDDLVEADNQQPMGEFMALHTANNTVHEETKAEDNEEDNNRHKKQKKTTRYLHDTDRYNIIRRIDNGEKQAALAREYGVTRAAICHIKKNREEIISRYNSLIKQTQEIDRAENLTLSSDEIPKVHEIQSSSVLVLMTTLRDKRTNPETFRRAAGRLIMMLLEEALAVTSSQAVETTTSTGYVANGLKRTEEVCGVAVGAEGSPFQVLFHQMEPDAAQGSIHVELEMDQHGRSVWRLVYMDLPREITQYRVLLYRSTVDTGEAECKAIEELCSLGVKEDRITLVFILCSTDSTAAISNRFPGVRIITGAIDSQIDPQTQAIIPGIGDFVSRYNGE